MQLEVEEQPHVGVADGPAPPRGIYLRDLRTRALIERVPWNGPVAEGDQCFTTNAWVTIAMRSQVSFIRRAATDTTVTIATRSAAVDLDRQRVALITPDGQLNTLEVDDGSR